MTDNSLHDQNIVSCEGEPEKDGHPRVFLTLEEGKDTICPYCGRLFQKGTSSHEHS